MNNEQDSELAGIIRRAADDLNALLDSADERGIIVEMAIEGRTTIDIDFRPQRTYREIVIKLIAKAL